MINLCDNSHFYWLMCQVLIKLVHGWRGPSGTTAFSNHNSRPAFHHATSRVKLGPFSGYLFTNHAFSKPTSDHCAWNQSGFITQQAEKPSACDAGSSWNHSLLMDSLLPSHDGPVANFFFFCFFNKTRSTSLSGPRAWRRANACNLPAMHEQFVRCQRGRPAKLEESPWWWQTRVMMVAEG